MIHNDTQILLLLVCDQPARSLVDGQLTEHCQFFKKANKFCGFFTHPKYIEYEFVYLQRLKMLRIYDSIYLYKYIKMIYTYIWAI